jgi:hypothetical protein
MSIQCQVCQKVFDKQITNTHLKQHNLSVVEYKKQFGPNSITCQEYKNYLSSIRQGKNNANWGKTWNEERKYQMSELKKGSTPWNKDKKIGASENLLLGIAKREEKYRSGDLIRQAAKPSDETKKKIAEGVHEWAVSNTELLKQNAQKAVDTKRLRGYDFGLPMRGKSHSETTKQILREQLNAHNSTRRKLSKIKAQENARSINCDVVSFSGNLVELKCTVCRSKFTYTKQYLTDSKIKSSLCNICNPRTQAKRSQAEIELFDYVYALDRNAVNNVKKIADGSEIDIYLPDKNVAIEFNGLYWHSEQVLTANGRNKLRDWKKWQNLLDKNIKLISIYEDEWEQNKEIVKSRLANILGKTSTVTYARKCELKEIDSKTASTFCNQNHIQGKGRSNYRVGLYHNNDLVSVMTFSNNNLSRRIKGWEINRFCSKLHTHVVGAASKLFAHFVKQINPDTVISYSDNRWSTGNLYKQLGFEFSHQTKPNYWYFLPNECKRIHRFALRRKSTDPQILTEKQLRDKQGFYRIWDLGNSKWVWKNKNGA